MRGRAWDVKKPVLSPTRMQLNQGDDTINVACAPWVVEDDVLYTLLHKSCGRNDIFGTHSPIVFPLLEGSAPFHKLCAVLLRSGDRRETGGLQVRQKEVFPQLFVVHHRAEVRAQALEAVKVAIVEIAEDID